jgi:organic radical activating enzyme
LKICPYPWLVFSVETKGTVRLCCDGEMLSRAIVDQNLKPFSLADEEFDSSKIINSPDLKRIRASYLKGVIPEICRKCDEINQFEGIRPREMYFEVYKNHISDLIKNTKLDGETNSKYISFDYSMSNECNLSCRMCRPEFSRSLSSVYESFNLDFEHIPKFSSTSKDLILKNFETLLPNLRYITFQGGEPIVSSVHQRMLQMIIDGGFEKNLHLIYVTNGTTINSKIFDLWSNFDKISLNLSLDGIGECYDYIRVNSSWKIIERNLSLLEKFQKIIPYFKLDIQSVLQAYNVLELKDLFQFMKSKKYLPDLPRLFYLREPNFLQAHLLREETRRKVHLEMQQYLSTHHCRDARYDNVQSCYSNLMTAKTDKDLLIKFKEYTYYLDEKNKTRFKFSDEFIS